MRRLVRLLRAQGFRPTRSLVSIAIVSLSAVMLETVALVLAGNIFGLVIEGGGSELVSFGPFELEMAVALTVGLLAVAVSCFAQIVAGRLTAHFSSRYLSALRLATLDAYQGASTSAQTNLDEGKVHELVSSIAYQASLLPMRAATMLTSGIATIAMLIAALVIEPVAAIALAFCGAALSLALRPIGGLASRAASRQAQSQVKLGQAIASWASRSREFRAFGVESESAVELHRLEREAADSLGHLRSVAQAGVAAYRSLTTGVLLLLVALASLSDAIDPVDATLVLVITARALSYAQQFNAARQVSSEAIGPAEELIGHAADLRRQMRAQGTVAPGAADRLRLIDVSLGYSVDAPLLKGVNLTINRGDVVALVGQSGTGKTTVLNVLLGLESPLHGRVLLDDLDVATLEPRLWAKICAFVPQDPSLMAGTVADNVRLFRTDLSNDQIRWATTQTGLDANAALRSDAKVGANEKGLSGGQIQRVALARALAGSPRFLLLDEPTSALDSNSEQIVLDALSDYRRHGGILIVSHRPLPLSICNRFVAIKDGQLIELESMDAAMKLHSLPTAAVGVPEQAR